MEENMIDEIKPCDVLTLKELALIIGGGDQKPGPLSEGSPAKCPYCGQYNCKWVNYY
jgi:hypothetical protein